MDMAKKKRTNRDATQQSKPSIYADEKQMPVLKGAEVGDKLKFAVHGKVTGLNENEIDGKKRRNYTVEVHKAKPLKGEKANKK